MVSHSILLLTFIEKKLWQWVYNCAKGLINTPSWNHLVELGTVFQSAFYVFYESMIYIEFSVPNKVHWCSNQEVEVGSPSHTITLIYPLENFALPISKSCHLSDNSYWGWESRTVLLSENTVWYSLNCKLELPHYYLESFYWKINKQSYNKEKSYNNNNPLWFS